MHIYIDCYSVCLIPFIPTRTYIIHHLAPCKLRVLQAQLETLQSVQAIIAKQLSIDESTVAPQTKFADLGADSRMS